MKFLFAAFELDWKSLNSVIEQFIICYAGPAVQLICKFVFQEQKTSYMMWTNIMHDWHNMCKLCWKMEYEGAKVTNYVHICTSGGKQHSAILQLCSNEMATLGLPCKVMLQVSNGQWRSIYSLQVDIFREPKEKIVNLFYQNIIFF